MYFFNKRPWCFSDIMASHNWIEFEAEASMRYLCLQVDSICLGHTLAFISLLWRVHMAPKLHLCPYLAILWPWPLTFGPRMFKMLNIAPISVFHWLILLPGTLEWWLPISIYAHTWHSDDIHFWRSNFQKCWTLFKQVFSIDKSCNLIHWMELWNQNCNFAHIWSLGELGLWPLDLKFSEMPNTASTSLCDSQKFPNWYIWMNSWLQTDMVTLKTQSRSNLWHALKGLVIIHHGYKYQVYIASGYWLIGICLSHWL